MRVRKYFADEGVDYDFLIGKRKSRERCSEVFCVQELFSFNIGVMF